MLFKEENKSKIRLMFRVNATKTVHAFNVPLVILLCQTTNLNKTKVAGDVRKEMGKDNNNSCREKNEIKRLNCMMRSNCSLCT